MALLCLLFENYLFSNKSRLTGTQGNGRRGERKAKRREEERRKGEEGRGREKESSISLFCKFLRYRSEPD